MSKKKTAPKKKASTAPMDPQLQAGGMLPIKTKVDAKSTEKVVARAYGGDVLGTRKIVRLGAERLGPAEDLAMEFLGLSPQGESKPLAYQSRRAMGFASWALITHPKNAKDALVLVKRIKAAGRKARSKPGHAWDAFTAMAEELGRSVRHFLPPFWEEVARIFKDLGNQTYAGRGLGKALEAERVHALDVDRTRRRDAVVEFALSGCLSGKALSEYTKDLEQQFSPDEALETFRDLLVRRTLGGMPPMAGAAKDLTRLAKLAGKDVNDEIDALLLEIIPSMAMSRAPKQFWKSVSKRVAALVKQQNSFGVWLLIHTNCESNYYSESSAWDWLDQLDQWGALPLLALPVKDLPDDVQIPGGRAGWFSRLASASLTPQDRYFDLLEQAAAALREEAVPIELGIQRGYRSQPADVDVLEACLEWGIPVVCVGDPPVLGFHGWMSVNPEHARRNSSLTHVLEDQRYAAAVRKLIPFLICSEQPSGQYQRGNTAGERRFDQAAEGNAALKDMWWEFLDHCLTRLEAAALGDIDQTMERVRTAVGRSTLKEFPAVMKRLKKLDFVAVLQRTLVGGAIDEYGWTDLETVDDESSLSAMKNREPVTYSTDSFPTVCYLRDAKIHCVGPDGIQTLGDSPIKGTSSPQWLQPVGQDTAVIFRDSSTYETILTWLSDPNQLHKEGINYWRLQTEAWMPVESGVFMGQRVLQAGDTNVPDTNHWFSDGTQFWNMKQGARSYHYGYDPDADHTTPQEIDPVTGKRIRDSVPAWFEPDLEAAKNMYWNLCYLMPSPKGIDTSPLGVVDGMIGWSVYRRRDGAIVGRGIDGRTCTLKPDGSEFDSVRVPIAMIDKPESNTFWILCQDGTLIDEETSVTIGLLPGNTNRYCEGQPKQLPALFLHLHALRCSQSSKALRKLSTKQTKALLLAGQKQHAAHRLKKEQAEASPDREAVSQAVVKWLPKAPPRLANGITKLIRLTAAEQASLGGMLNRLSEPPKERKSSETSNEKQPFSPSAGGVSEVAYPWAGTDDNVYRYGNRGASTLHIETVVEFFKTGKVTKISNGEPDWIAVLDDACTGAWIWFWKQVAEYSALTEVQLAYTPKQHFEDLIGVRGLAYLAESGILDWKGEWVYYVAKPMDETEAALPKNKPFVPSRKQPVAFNEGNNRYIAFPFGGYSTEQIHILEYAPGGKPKPPKVHSILKTIPIRRRWRSKEIQRFVDAVRKLETLPLIDREKVEAAAEKLSASSAQVGIAYMGNMRTNTYGQEKLTKSLRAHYGWKVTDIKSAIAGLEAEGLTWSLLATGLFDDPGGAIGVRKDAAFDRFVAAWAKQRESSIQVSPEVAAPMEHLGFGYPRFDPQAFMEILAAPTESQLLQERTTSFSYEMSTRSYQPHSLEAVYSPNAKMDLRKIVPHLMEAIGYLNYSLPFGDPARRRIPDLIQQIRQWLDLPTTTLEVGLTSATRNWQNADKINIDETLDRFSKLLGKAKKQTAGHWEFDSGLLIAGVFPPVCRLHFRTSKLKTAKDLDKIAAVCQLTYGYEGDGAEKIEFAQSVLELRSDVADQLIAANQSNNVPDGTCEQDPRRSVPKLVQQVAKQCKLSADAATLYLQILALPDPTNKNIQRWNDWKAAALKKTAAELVEKKLLVQAKRSRAGRDIFLPGGWEALKLPNLPVETWKLALFGLQNTERLRGGTAALLVCKRPLPEHFMLAWQRVQSGDGPRYEDSLS